MATRSLASVKVVVTMFSTRREFTAAVEATRKNVLSQKLTEKEPAPWIPDPITGYYRPENVSNEIDVAELRQVLLKQSKDKKN